MSEELEEFFEQVGAHPTAAIKRGHPAVDGSGNEWAQKLAAASCWAQSGTSYFPVTQVVDKMPAGAFRCMMSNQGPYFEKMKINTDDLLNLPDSATESLIAEFNQFWKLKPSFEKRGFTFKRGLLMWGPPGSGKTSAVWQMTNSLIKNYNGLVIFIEDPQIAIFCLSVLRRVEPDRPIITIMEDIDAIVNQHGDHGLLALLDGEFQTSNVVHIGTTNYPHLLDRRFVDRPSRFDTIMKVGMPSAAARDVYFRAKEPELSEHDRARWVRRTEGYSIAHCREVCIAIQCFRQPEDKVFERLDKMRERIRINEDGDETKPAGFVHLAEQLRLADGLKRGR